MQSLRHVARRTGSVILTAALAAITGLCLWQMMMGENGLMSLGEVRAEHALLQQEAARLAAEREKLEHRVELMGERAEPDYAEELVRRRLGLVREDEIIVRLDD